MACGADNEANDLMRTLIGTKGFELPVVDLTDPAYAIPEDGSDGMFAPVTRLTNDDLTTGAITGNGTFDALMKGFNAHLKKEFEGGRITGEQYAKAYVALVEGAMANATQYLLGRDGAYWQAVTAQIQARQARVQEVTARVQLAVAKVQLISTQYEAMNQEAQYALTKMRLSTESMQYCISKYNLENILPQQLLLAKQQLTQAVEQTKLTVLEGQISKYNLDFTLPEQLLLARSRTAASNVEVDTGKYNLANLLPQQLATGAFNLTEMLPQQLLLSKEQIKVMKEQTEVQRAQTLDTRTDGAAVVGLLGKQKDLYSQQITSYMRDSEMKAAKLFTDAWITMKTIDEGLEPPVNFANVSLNGILGKIKTNNNIG